MRKPRYLAQLQQDINTLATRISLQVRTRPLPRPALRDLIAFRVARINPVANGIAAPGGAVGDSPAIQGLRWHAGDSPAGSAALSCWMPGYRFWCRPTRPVLVLKRIGTGFEIPVSCAARSTCCHDLGTIAPWHPFHGWADRFRKFSGVSMTSALRVPSLAAWHLLPTV
jgi:hypothetical protein